MLRHRRSGRRIRDRVPAGTVAPGGRRPSGTTLEVIGFYSCVGIRTAWQARLVTAHLSGWQRLAAAGWHAISEHFASCLVAEILDDFLIRPLAVAGAAGLMRPLPGGIWLGLLAGKLAADVAWYAMEASARSAAARRGGRS